MKTGVRCTSTYHELRTLNVSWAETWRHRNILVNVLRLAAVNKCLSSSNPDLIGFCVSRKLIPKSAPHLRQTPQFDFIMLSSNLSRSQTSPSRSGGPIKRSRTDLTTSCNSLYPYRPRHPHLVVRETPTNRGSLRIAGTTEAASTMNCGWKTHVSDYSLIRLTRYGHATLPPTSANCGLHLSAVSSICFQICRRRYFGIMWQVHTRYLPIVFAEILSGGDSRGSRVLLTGD